MTGARSADLAFSTARFREEREADWNEFDRLLTRLERGSARSLTDEELLRLPVLYRATLSSLSIARATSLDRAMLDYLEGLSIRGYFLLYGVRESTSKRIGKFFTQDWPRAVRALWKEVLIATVVTALAIFAGYSLVAENPEWYHSFVPEDLADGRVPGASPTVLAETLKADPQSGLEAFATMLFTHNSQVAIMAFALGFAFGLPTLVLLLYNGLMMGAMIFVFADAGLGPDFVGWLFIHGTTEIFAIILAGAAGLKIGTAVAFPGAHDRLYAASTAGRTAATVMIGVVIMLAIAGLLEGFGRQLVGPTPARYGIGTVMLIFWLAYFFIPGRKPKDTVPASGLEPAS